MEAVSNRANKSRSSLGSDFLVCGRSSVCFGHHNPLDGPSPWNAASAFTGRVFSSRLQFKMADTSMSTKLLGRIC